MKYTFTLSTTEASIFVESPSFPLFCGEQKVEYVFLDKTRPPVKGKGSPVRWGSLPMRVRATITMLFETVLALPADGRKAYLHNFEPLEIDA